MIEWIAIGATVGGLAVKAWDFFIESITIEPELSYSEREALKKKEKENKEIQEWANRAILSDSAFEALKKQLQEYSSTTGTNYAYPSSLIASVLELNMRFSMKQINALKPVISHWCVYDGVEDKPRTINAFLNTVKDGLTAKAEAREVILNLLLEEKP